MNVILYENTETQFTSNGLGMLSPIECFVTEELNGEFECETVISMDDTHAPDLQNDRIILAKPDPDHDPEPFRIYKISKPLNGKITVSAEHISYQLNHIPVMPFTATNASSAIAGIKTNSAETNPFTFSTDMLIQKEFKVDAPTSARALLGGDNSLLNTYGGEFRFSKWNVYFNTSRGQQRDVTIRYGKNLVDIKQEEHIQNMMTGICPYWTKEDETVTLPERVVHANVSGISYPRTQVVNLSSQFEDAPTVEDLRQAAQDYILANGIGVPEISIHVEFVALWQTEQYKDIAPLEYVMLGDTIKVQFEKLGISTSAKIVKYKYDVLKERYESLDIGSVKPNLESDLVKTTKGIERTIETQSSMLQYAITKATEMITGNRGGYFVIHDADGDGKPDEVLFMDTPSIATAQNVWRWNLSGLGFSSSGYNGTYALAITADGSIVANFITTGTLLADLIKAGTLSDYNGTFSIDFTNANGIQVTDNGQAGNRANLKVVKGNDQAQIYSDAFYLLDTTNSPNFEYAEMTTGGFRASGSGGTVMATPNLLQISNGTNSLVYNSGADTFTAGGRDVLRSGDLDQSFSDINSTLGNHATEIYDLGITVRQHQAWIDAHSST